jgi:hypothetical protein
VTVDGQGFTGAFVGAVVHGGSSPSQDKCIIVKTASATVAPNGTFHFSIEAYSFIYVQIDLPAGGFCSGYFHQNPFTPADLACNPGLGGAGGSAGTAGSGGASGSAGAGGLSLNAHADRSG